MYLSQADLLEMDHDQLVGKILMRMTPWQFETRCTRNVVHFVLSEQQRCHPLWSNPAVHTLLGKGPRFYTKGEILIQDGSSDSLRQTWLQAGAGF